MKRRLAFFLPSSLTLLFPFTPLSSLLQAISSFISFLLAWCTSSSCSIVSFWAFHHLISPPPVFLHSYSILLLSFLPHSSSFTPFVIVPPPLCLRLFYISLSCFHLPLLPPYPIISSLHSSSPFSNNPV